MEQVPKKNRLETRETREAPARMKYSSELIRNPILEGEPGYDKIFLCGVARKGARGWEFHIASDAPTAADDENIRTEFGLSHSPTVKEVRNGSALPGLSLLSAGSFIWLNEGGTSKLVLLQRDNIVPVDTGLLTGPAGRCGEAPSKTARDESNQELCLLRQTAKDHRFKIVGFYDDDREKNDIIRQKLEQIRSVYDTLRKQGRDDGAKELLSIRGEDDVEMIRRSAGPHPGHTERVVTLVDGEPVDVIENATVFFDEPRNTLEVRVHFEVNVWPDTTIVVRDGETYARNIVTVDPAKESLEDERFTSTLRHLYGKLKTDA